MKKRLVREYYELATNDSVLRTKNGKGFKLVYVDPNMSTDSTFDNKELMKKYGMEYLPYNRYIRNIQGVPKAWGWIVWDGSEQEVYPLIKKFAEEIGSQQEHFNYLANWGMNVSNCSDVFDSIMKVADFMYEGIMKQLNNE
jgi:hypothetical protein